MLKISKLESVAEELETLIHENINSSTNCISAASQTSWVLDQHDKQWREELERKNLEVQILAIKSKEAEADLLRKEIIIEGISEKVPF